MAYRISKEALLAGAKDYCYSCQELNGVAWAINGAREVFQRMKDLEYGDHYLNRCNHCKVGGGMGNPVFKWEDNK